MTDMLRLRMLGQPWHFKGICFKTDGFPRVWFLFMAIIIWSSAVLLNTIPTLLLQSSLLHLLPAKSGDALFDVLISLAKKCPLQNHLPLATGVQTTNQGSEVLIISSSSTTVWVSWAQTRSSASTIPAGLVRLLPREYGGSFYIEYNGSFPLHFRRTGSH